MSNGIDCSQCRTLVDLSGQPVLCHVCPMGHVLCEKCNDVARYYCFHCGGKTERKVPNKDVKELFRVSPDVFMKKLLNSSTLIPPERCRKTGKAISNGSPTVIGFKKWPRKFFHKIPDVKDTVPYNDQQFLEMLPDIIENEPSPTKPTQVGCWDSLPKSFTDFKMSSKIMSCPITTCQYPICNSDATRHLLQSHENIPIEMLARHNIANFSVSLLCRKQNEVRTLLRILVPGVILDLGITKHNNCLPLYLLCTRVNAIEAEQDAKKISNTRNTANGSPVSNQLPLSVLETQNDNDNAARMPWKNSDCVLIWCAGIVPLDHPISVAISVFPRDDKSMNLGALVKVFSLHLPQTAHDIYKSTERLMITKNDLLRLTNSDSVFDGQISIM